MCILVSQMKQNLYTAVCHKWIRECFVFVSRQSIHLDVCVCVWTISFEQYDFGPRYLECWFSLILSHAAPGSPAPLINLLILALYVSHLLVYIVCFPTYLFSLLVFSFENRPSPFQARGHKMQPNLGSFRCFSLFYVIVFLCFWYMIICVLLA